MNRSLQIAFPGGEIAHAVAVRWFDALPDAVSRLGLGRRRAIVVVGGAGGLSEDEHPRLAALLSEAVVPVAESLDATVLDGGTDAGVMRWMGRARADSGGRFPLVGVAAVGTVAIPGGAVQTTGAALLAPHHSHFVLVPGHRWGDESPWLARFATVVSAGLASATVVINGGEVTWDDVACSIRERRPVLVLAGSGRTADALATGLKGATADPRAVEMAASGLVEAVDASLGPAALTEALQRRLVAGGPAADVQ